MIRAVISLGTNTTRLLVVRDRAAGGLEQIEHAQTGTRLGEGMTDGGSISPAAMERTLAVVRDFTVRAAGHGAALSSIATSAVRRADNAAAFAERMRAITRVPLNVLDGLTEAQASFRGATYGASLAGKRIAVLDVGGGSTECAVGRDGILADALSVEIGSVRIAERWPALTGAEPGPAAHAAAAAARTEIARRLAPLERFGAVDEVRCVAGTPLTIGAIVAGSHVERVSGMVLSRATLDGAVAHLLELTLAERRALPGMPAQRADVVAGGALIVSEALRLLGVTAGRLESNDLLLGWLLMERAGSTANEPHERTG